MNVSQAIGNKRAGCEYVDAHFRRASLRRTQLAVGFQLSDCDREKE